MAGQWVKVHRKILKSRVFSDASALKVWVWCLLKSNWKDGFHMGEEIPVGSFATGRKQAAKELRMGEYSVRRYLRKLQGWGLLTLKPHNRFTHVTICNWRTYQDTNRASRTSAAHQPHISRTSAAHQPHTIEEGLRSIKKGKKGERRTAFTPPTPSDVAAYCEELGKHIDPDKFVDHYSQSGWKLKGGAPMKDWKAAVRLWARRDAESAANGVAKRLTPAEQAAAIMRKEPK